MNDSTLTAVIIALVSGLVLALFTVVLLGAKRWLNHVDSLQASMDQLRNTITGLSEKFVTIAQYREDQRRMLHAQSALGRRAVDHCASPDCPFEKTAPLFLLPDDNEDTNHGGF